MLADMKKAKTKAEVQIRVSGSYLLSGPAAARLLIAIALIIAALATATMTHDEFARGALYGAAGFLTGSRPRKP